MPEIVLTDEQARVLAAADGAVTVRDPAGQWLGVLDAADPPTVVTVDPSRPDQGGPPS